MSGTKPRWRERPVVSLFLSSAIHRRRVDDTAASTLRKHRRRAKMSRPPSYHSSAAGSMHVSRRTDTSEPPDKHPPAPRWGRVARLLAAALVGLLVGLLIASLLLSQQYVAAITNYTCPPSGFRPEEVGLDGYRDVTFETADGVTLSGWYLPGRNDATIVLLEGMGARGGLLPEGKLLADHGYGLLLFDWRGCGRSGQAIHTLGYHETEDLLAAVAFLASQPDAGQIGALGFSLGGAVAIRGAAADPRIKAVVAMGNYHDLEVEIYGAGDDAPLVSWLLEKEIAWLFQRQTAVDFATAPEPVDAIGQITPRPVLLIYGEEEEALPPASGQLLHQAAGPGTELWLLPDVGHGGYLSAAPVEFSRRVLGFFDRVLLP